MTQETSMMVIWGPNGYKEMEISPKSRASAARNEEGLGNKKLSLMGGASAKKSLEPCDLGVRKDESCTMSGNVLEPSQRALNSALEFKSHSLNQSINQSIKHTGENRVLNPTSKVPV